MSEPVAVGQLWEHVGGGPPHHGAARGVCIVVAPNDSPESPESWIMLSLSQPRVLYMHRSARMAREWVRYTAVARVA